MTITDRSTPLSRHLRLIASGLDDTHAAESINTAAELLEAVLPAHAAPAIAGVEAREALEPFARIGRDILVEHSGWANDVFASEWCGYRLTYKDFERARLAALPPSQEVPAQAIEDWIEREFSGYGVAVRRKDESPIPGEPFMSMAEAKELLRRALRTFAAPPQCAREADEQAIKLHIDSALNWYEVFDDGRGANDLTKQQTSEMLCRRLAAALSGKPGAEVTRPESETP